MKVAGGGGFEVPRTLRGRLEGFAADAPPGPPRTTLERL
jgi:hypothetical protein